MHDVLPLLLTVPHSSIDVPDGLYVRMLRRTPDADAVRAQLLRNADMFTDEIYDIPVRRRIVATWSRFVADPNRSRSGDVEDAAGITGPIRVVDFDGVPLFRDEDLPTAADRERWLQLAWDPFHAALDDGLADPSVRLVVDCHSMAKRYHSGPKKGLLRPAICICNAGAVDTGEPTPRRPKGVTADPAFVRLVAEMALDAFAPLFHEDGPTGVAINRPFPGGHIIRRASKVRPAIAIEINQGLYISPDARAIPGRIEEIRVMLTTLFGRIAGSLS